MAKRIIQTHKTNNPFELADIYDINVSDEPLPTHIGGFYTKIFGYAYIVINSDKPPEWRRAIAAHELGHALLHGVYNHTFIAMNTFVAMGKLEREANIFAATLLLDEEKPLEGESISNFAKRTSVPIEFVETLGKESFL